MPDELRHFLPAALGIGVGVLVWAILCAIARKRKQEQTPKCEICPKCERTLMGRCVGFPHHNHEWCNCRRYWAS